MDTNTLDDCKGCRATVHLAPGEVERILAEIAQGSELPLTDDVTYQRRLSVCGACPDLRYGTTCRHCGCLVAVRAKMLDKQCPAARPRW